MKVAVIGMGTMGAPMAANLLKAGHDVVVHNRTRSKEEPLVALGATSAVDPASAASGAQVVITNVSDTPDVEDVLLTPGSGVIESLQPESLVIDCSTISPDGTRKIGAKFREKHIGFVDAPVSGGSEGAIKGTLTIMCGGSQEDFDRALPVLEILGKQITLIGPLGCGQIAKAVNQVVITGTFQSLAEGLALACRAGADPDRVVSAIGGGVAGSWILTNRSKNMLKDDYPLGFRVRLHRKDLAIALETARQLNVPLPVAGLVAAMEDILISQGYGDKDMSVLAQLIRRGAGIPDGPMSS